MRPADTTITLTAAAVYLDRVLAASGACTLLTEAELRAWRAEQLQRVRLWLLTLNQTIH